MPSITRLATIAASSGPRTSSSSTVNSSPPMRNIMSASRTARRMRSAATRSSRSPASWPRLSFTRLKRSRSRNSSASGQLARFAVGLVADALLLRGALALRGAHHALVAHEDELHYAIDEGHRAQHRGENRPLRALGLLDERGDVVVDLEHRLDRLGVVHVNRHIGGENVPVGDLALPAVQAPSVGEVARRIPIA